MRPRPARGNWTIRILLMWFVMWVLAFAYTL